MHNLCGGVSILNFQRTLATQLWLFESLRENRMMETFCIFPEFSLDYRNPLRRATKVEKQNKKENKNNRNLKERK